MWLTTTLSVSESGHVSYEKVNSGFLVEKGAVIPIVRADIRATSLGMQAISDHIVVTDAAGRSLEFFGSAIGTRPMGSINPSIAAFVSLMRYRCKDRTGYGGHGKLFGLAYLAERRQAMRP